MFIKANDLRNGRTLTLESGVQHKVGEGILAGFTRLNVFFFMFLLLYGDVLGRKDDISPNSQHKLVEEEKASVPFN